MKQLKYFYINNIKFNYDIEFNSNHKNDYWKQNAPLIEYCETVGVNIPHYCYHKNLSISGNCRMCLVELKNSPKPVVSCSMSAKSCLNNSKVYTDSPLVKKARENILEFLLLNHPLDCPICDQGGECDLQDQSFFFGISKKRFYNFKRVVTDKNIGPIVKTVMTRCIHCTRCVRFSSEIAGTNELGMFGRGLDSEIGTYVQKTFQSELSGNVIDLCPVGALTSKPYPFVSRNWELKNVNSIDFSDSSIIDLQVYLKNNKIVKILPGIDKHINKTNWISDKTRFNFDGMFSSERILTGYVINGNKKILNDFSWKSLFNEIIITLYFHDHLNKHFFNKNKLITIIDNNIGLETLALLKLLEKKYSFIKLRTLATNSCNKIDFESNFLTNTDSLDINKLETSQLCLLFGINPRYENPQINIKLRQRYLKGNFKILSYGSNINPTFSVNNKSFNAKMLAELAEGNAFLCQEILNTNNPLLLLSSEIFNRKDNNKLNTITNFLNEILKNKYPNWSSVNYVNTSLNEAGVKYLDSIKPISIKDLKNNFGMFFINLKQENSNLKKIINLKLLNYSNEIGDFNLPKFCLESNNGLNSAILKKFSGNNSYKIYNYINLPNATLFESTNTFLNNEGVFKKNIKIMNSPNQTKEDWQIVRKLFAYSKKINFISKPINNKLLTFKNSNANKFKSFLNLLMFSNNTITNFTTNNKTSCYDLNNLKFIYKNKQSKLYSTKFKLWLNDFYIGGKDFYSKNSTTMISCSKQLRIFSSNFKYII